MDCAERSQISFTALTPVQLLKMIGKADTKPTSSTAGNIAEAEPEQETAAHRRGRGLARRSLTSGRQISSARRERPINTPIVTPMTRGQREPAEQANDRLDGVMRQDSRNREMHEGGRDFFQCRKQPARKYASPGDDLPNCANDDERKKIARDQPQALAALGTDGSLCHADGDGILHRCLTSSPGQATCTGRWQPSDRP